MIELDDLLAQIVHAKDTSQLEVIGKGLTASHFLSLLSEAAMHPANYATKISPILVGLSPSVFEHVLAYVRPKHIEVLKRESTAEPLQHHLTLLVHEQEGAWEGFSIVKSTLLAMVDKLDPDLVSSSDIDSINTEAVAATTTIHHRLEVINVALALAWNSTRVDLVDRLSRLKEHLLEIENLKEQVEDFLKIKLEKIFGDFKNPQEVDAVSNEDPAIEGLVKFSLWYPEDYWEIGLLPQIKRKEDLYPNGENQREERTKVLLATVTANLANLDLKTVADLKNAFIYSRRMLQEYIAASIK